MRYTAYVEPRVEKNIQDYRTLRGDNQPQVKVTSSCVVITPGRYFDLSYKRWLAKTMQTLKVARNGQKWVWVATVDRTKEIVDGLIDNGWRAPELSAGALAAIEGKVMSRVVIEYRWDKSHPPSTFVGINITLIKSVGRDDIKANDTLSSARMKLEVAGFERQHAMWITGDIYREIWYKTE